MVQGSGNEIRIPIRVELEDARKQLGQLRKLVAKGIGGDVTRGFNVDMLEKQEAKVKSLAQSYAKPWKDFPQMLQPVKASFEDVNAMMGRLGKNAKTASIPFAGWAMSLMFAGMQIKMMFEGLAKSAIASFQEISHSVEGNVTNMDLLNAEWAYLKFSIGEALGPVIGFLIPIVAAMADWVSENQALTAGLIAGGIALGSLLFFGGQLKLAIDGVRGAILVLKAAFPALAVAGKLSFGAMFAAFWPIALAIAAAILLWKTDLGGFRDFVKKTFSGIVQVVKGIWGGITKVFSGVWDIIQGLFTGNFGLLLQGFLKVGQGILTIFSKVFGLVGMIVWNVIAFVVNAIASMLVSTFRNVLSIIESMIALANRLGANISTSGIGRVRGMLDNLGRPMEYTNVETVEEKTGMKNLYDNRVFNITIDQSTDQTVIDQILAQLRASQ